MRLVKMKTQNGKSEVEVLPSKVEQLKDLGYKIIKDTYIQDRINKREGTENGNVNSIHKGS